MALQEDPTLLHCLKWAFVGKSGWIPRLQSPPYHKHAGSVECPKLFRYSAHVRTLNQHVKNPGCFQTVNMISRIGRGCCLTRIGKYSRVSTFSLSACSGLEHVNSLENMYFTSFENRTFEERFNFFYSFFASTLFNQRKGRENDEPYGFIPVMRVWWKNFRKLISYRLTRLYRKNPSLLTA